MLNNIGPSGLILIAVVTLLLFGRGKVGALMGEMGTGIKAFRKGLREGEPETPAPVATAPTPDEHGSGDPSRSRAVGPEGGHRP